jgi:hypothetical protein
VLVLNESRQYIDFYVAPMVQGDPFVALDAPPRPRMGMAAQPLLGLPSLATSTAVRCLHQPFRPTSKPLPDLRSASHLACQPLRRLFENTTATGPVHDRHGLRMAVGELDRQF